MDGWGKNVHQKNANQRKANVAIYIADKLVSDQRFVLAKRYNLSKLASAWENSLKLCKAKIDRKLGTFDKFTTIMGDLNPFFQ